jgi:hypothetical protein
MQVNRYTKVVLTIIAALSPQPAMAGVSLATEGAEQLRDNSTLYINLNCSGCN